MVDQNYSEKVTNTKTLIEDVKKCDTKDASGLNDFQQLPTEDIIDIPKVGISRFRMPILIENSEKKLVTSDASASMYVALNGAKNGISMSRLCSILQQETLEQKLDLKLIKKILSRYLLELSDSKDTKAIESASLKIKFNYAIKQQSLKSDNWGWQYYPIIVEGIITPVKGFQFFISIDYEYSSTCPCSLSMAKQYEKDFASGSVTEGAGIGVAHSQRSLMQTKVEVGVDFGMNLDFILSIIRSAIPTETQSLVKRVDEQAFAILNGTYPIFVEHASKEIYKKFNESKEIIDWIASFEHFESLHSHNAAAVIYKGIEGGLRNDNVF